MLKRIVFGMMLTLLLIGVLTLTLNVQPVKASGTITIRADGSIDPSGVPINTTDMVTYCFTDNINDSIVVERDNIVIDGSGYTVQGTGSGDGIYLSGRSNVTIKNVEVIMFLRGIWLDRSINNILTNNTIRLNSGRGILLYDRSNDNIISNSTISDNNGIGIRIRSVYHGGEGASNNNIVINCKIYNNTRQGIDIYGSANNEVRNCLLKSNGLGTFDAGGLFISDYSSNTLIINTEISLNNGNGINVGYASGRNTIKCCAILENSGDGVHAWDTTNNILTNNNITNNNYGVYFISNARNNTVYHNNFINNTKQAYSEHLGVPLINIWDDGYPSGGNYWSDYTGVDVYTGPYQNETGSDGIGDTPYIINAENKDRYPLMNLSSPIHNVAIRDITPLKTVVLRGYDLNINVILANDGCFTETFNVTTYFDNTTIETKTVSNLLPGADTTVTVTWNTTSVALGKYTLSAHASPVPGETETADNTLTDGWVMVSPYLLSVKLSGEFDYMPDEPIKIRLAALVTDAQIGIPVSNANVTLDIYDLEGNLMVSTNMVERLVGTGIYEWESPRTIRWYITRGTIEKGVYLVHVQASFALAPIASDILEFHIDPSPEGLSVTHIVAIMAIIAAVTTSLILLKQPIKRLWPKKNSLK